MIVVKIQFTAGRFAMPTALIEAAGGKQFKKKVGVL